MAVRRHESKVLVASSLKSADAWRAGIVSQKPMQEIVEALAVGNPHFKCRSRVRDKEIKVEVVFHRNRDRLKCNVMSMSSWKTVEQVPHSPMPQRPPARVQEAAVSPHCGCNPVQVLYAKCSDDVVPCLCLRKTSESRRRSAAVGRKEIQRRCSMPP